MEQYNKLIGTIASIRDVRIKRNAHEYSHELGVALETKFKFSKSSSKGNVYLNIVFFDASKNEEIDKENIEKNCEAVINLNYLVILPEEVSCFFNEKLQDKEIWEYIYPQVKVDVALYCNSICLPNFIIPRNIDRR